MSTPLAFRFALSYPDERHAAYFAAALDDLRALYISLFEAGMPHPKCPLLESYYVASRPAPEVVLENKLFYKHFGLDVRSNEAPDSLLTQLEFLGWLDHCIEAGNPDRESLERARADFLKRHLANWVPRAASLLDDSAGPYGELMTMLAGWVSASPGTDSPGPCDSRQ